MLIDMYGNIDHDVKGVVTKDKNITLGENQFLQWSPTGKRLERLELWEGKQEYLQNEDPDYSIRRIKYWNDSSVYGFIYGFIR